MNQKPSALPSTMSPNNLVSAGLWSNHNKPVERNCEESVWFYPCDKTATHYEVVTMGNGYTIHFYACDDHARRGMMLIEPIACAECGEVTDIPQDHICPETAQADG